MIQSTLRDCHRPYLIVADFPGELPRAIARTYNKVDAEDSVRFLKRKTGNGSYFIVFDPEPQKTVNGA